MARPIMSVGASQAFALIRIPRGQARPSEDELRQALEQDRQQIGEAARATRVDVHVAGPYHVLVDGAELDEYVVWER